MSYISIIIPAFYLNTKDLIEIQKHCSIQFNLSQENYELFKINDNSDNLIYGLKFNNSSLCLSSLEDLIYQRNCMQSLCEKTYESLLSMQKRLNELENQLHSFTKNNTENNNKELMIDNIKLQNLLTSQIKYFDNFRINTENTLNKIKGQFKSVVNELEKLRIRTDSRYIDINICNNGSENIITTFNNRGKSMGERTKK